MQYLSQTHETKIQITSAVQNKPFTTTHSDSEGKVNILRVTVLVFVRKEKSLYEHVSNSARLTRQRCLIHKYTSSAIGNKQNYWILI